MICHENLPSHLDKVGGKIFAPSTFLHENVTHFCTLAPNWIYDGCQKKCNRCMICKKKVHRISEMSNLVNNEQNKL